MNKIKEIIFFYLYIFLLFSFEGIYGKIPQTEQVGSQLLRENFPGFYEIIIKNLTSKKDITAFNKELKLLKKSDIEATIKKLKNIIDKMQEIELSKSLSTSKKKIEIETLLKNQERLFYGTIAELLGSSPFRKKHKALLKRKAVHFFRDTVLSQKTNPGKIPDGFIIEEILVKGKKKILIHRVFESKAGETNAEKKSQIDGFLKNLQENGLYLSEEQKYLPADIMTGERKLIQDISTTEWTGLYDIYLTKENLGQGKANIISSPYEFSSHISKNIFLNFTEKYFSDSNLSWKNKKGSIIDLKPFNAHFFPFETLIAWMKKNDFRWPTDSGDQVEVTLKNWIDKQGKDGKAVIHRQLKSQSFFYKIGPPYASIDLAYISQWVKYNDGWPTRDTRVGAIIHRWGNIQTFNFEFRRTYENTSKRSLYKFLKIHNPDLLISTQLEIFKKSYKKHQFSTLYYLINLAKRDKSLPLPKDFDREVVTNLNNLNGIQNIKCSNKTIYELTH